MRFPNFSEMGCTICNQSKSIQTSTVSIALSILQRAKHWFELEILMFIVSPIVSHI